MGLFSFKLTSNRLFTINVEILINSELREYPAEIHIIDSEVEIVVYETAKTGLLNEFANWIFSKRDYRLFKDHVKLTLNGDNPVLKKIDYSRSEILGMTTGFNLGTQRSHAVSIKLSEIAVHLSQEDEDLENSKIYLNNQGFELVKDFYSPLNKLVNDNLVYNRRVNQDSFYNLGQSRFRPEFEFNYTDSIHESITEINKVPIITFHHKNDLDEIELTNYLNIACKATSFYLGINVDYDYACINLKGKQIFIFKTPSPQIVKRISSLNHLLSVRGTDGFLNLNWAQGYLKNRKKLDKMISSFIQARNLDHNSKFLVLYNILEIASAGIKRNSEEFNLIVSVREKTRIYKNAFQLLKETIVQDEHKMFRNKWEYVQKKLVYKPMKNNMRQFLIESDLPVEKFPVEVNDLLEMRNKITHGSVSSINSQKLIKANQLLYTISSLLILNLLEIKDWKFPESLLKQNGV